MNISGYLSIRCNPNHFFSPSISSSLSQKIFCCYLNFCQFLVSNWCVSRRTSLDSKVVHLLSLAALATITLYSCQLFSVLAIAVVATKIMTNCYYIKHPSSIELVNTINTQSEPYFIQEVRHATLSLITIACLNGTAKVYNAHDGSVFYNLAPQGSRPDKEIASFFQLRDNKLCGIFTNCKKLSIWNLTSKTETFLDVTPLSKYHLIPHIKLKDDSIAIACGENQIKILNLQSDTLSTYQTNNHEKPICSFIQLRDGRIATQFLDGKIEIHSLNKNQNALCLASDHPNRSNYLELLNPIELPDGRIAIATRCHHLASALDNSDTIIDVWNLNNTDAPEFSETIPSTCFQFTQLQDGRVIAGFDDKTLRIWDFTNSNPHKILQQKDVFFHIIELQNGKIALNAGLETLIYDLNFDQNTPSKILEGAFLAAFQNGNIVTYSYDSLAFSNINIWNLANPHDSVVFRTFNTTIACVTQMQNNQLAIGYTNGTIDII